MKKILLMTALVFSASAIASPKSLSAQEAKIMQEECAKEFSAAMTNKQNAIQKQLIDIEQQLKERIANISQTFGKTASCIGGVATGLTDQLKIPGIDGLIDNALSGIDGQIAAQCEKLKNNFNQKLEGIAKKASKSITIDLGDYGSYPIGYEIKVKK